MQVRVPEAQAFLADGTIVPLQVSRTCWSLWPLSLHCEPVVGTACLIPLVSLLSMCYVFPWPNCPSHSLLSSWNMACPDTWLWDASPQVGVSLSPSGSYPLHWVRNCQKMHALPSRVPDPGHTLRTHVLPCHKH
jgi:hypothetical protein